jgi:hypothetical protein
VQIRDIRSTDLFADTPQLPLQILRVTLADGDPSLTVSVRAEGPGVSTPEPLKSQVSPEMTNGPWIFRC